MSKLLDSRHGCSPAARARGDRQIGSPLAPAFYIMFGALAGLAATALMIEARPAAAPLARLASARSPPS